MRKRKLKSKKTLTMKKIIFVFFIVLCFMSVGYSLLSEQLTITGKGNIVVNTAETKGDIKFSYTVDEWYNNGIFYYNYNVTMVNLTEENIEGWTIEVEIPSDITTVTCWNAVCSIVDGKLIIKNESYNSILYPNVETLFGIHIYTGTENLELENVTINGKPVNNETGTTNPDNSGETGGNTGGDSGETGGNTGGDSGETGGNTGGDSGETGGNTGGDSGETGGNTGGDSGETGGNTGGDSGETGGNSGEIIINPDGSITKGFSTLILDSEWGNPGAYTRQYSLVIKNDKEYMMESWSVELYLPEGVVIDNAWGMNYVQKEDVVKFSSDQYNVRIQSGESKSYTFHVGSTTNDYDATIGEITSN